jgi:hypothetical protein
MFQSRLENSYNIFDSLILSREIIRNGEESLDSFGVTLREIFMQESLAVDDMDALAVELVLCACYEINYSLSSASRRQAFEFLATVLQLPAGKKELYNQAQPGGLLQKVAEKVFEE